METAPRQTSALAVVSLVCGILGWIALPVIGSLVAVVTGHLARTEIRIVQNLKEGDGLAVAGLVLGYLQLALAILAIFVLVFFLGGLAWLAAMSGH